MRFTTTAGLRKLGCLRYALVGAALVGFSAAAQAPLDVRVALVVGNAAYAHVPALPNPGNDAAGMAATLRKMGFTVTEVRDGSRDQMLEAIRGLQQQMKGRRAVGMFYYAGHGLQLDWRNYMLPVEAAPRSAAEVPGQGVAVDEVLEAFKASGNRINIVVLDACRDNPFPAAASGRGLAQVDAPPGTILAYATAPGNVAADGDGGNGLYTGLLLAELPKPGARIEDVFKRVRMQVRQRSQGRQIPWESTSLEDDFVFNDGRPAAPPPSPDAAFAAQKADWDRIRGSRNPDDFYAFLAKYPNGYISETALERLNLLSRPQVEATPAKGRKAIVRDPRVGDEFEFSYRDLNGRETRRLVMRTTALHDGIVEFNGGQQVLTVAGATVRNDIGFSFDPPLQVLPAGDVQIGMKWVSRSDVKDANGRSAGWTEQSFKVAAYEPVTVAAGTFDAYRIESEFHSQKGAHGTITFWFTDTGTPVKTLRRTQLPNGQQVNFDSEALRIKRCRAEPGTPAFAASPDCRT